ncbi:MAG TPA: TIGR02221 family CRISPR-associated protein [Armatimonadetes bacterium]|nr:TIGR02221 family CRISPR-associated protein [Armatimonadota bacterium]
MARIALSFIGTSKYEPVTYVCPEGEFETNLFPEAVARIYKVDKIFVLVTPEAKKHENFRNLKRRLGRMVKAVDIPAGKREEELWQIFEACTGVVGRDDKVILDITHSFRSIPMMVLVVTAFLRRVKGAEVERIIYGAYEARDEKGRAPIFDLTPLVDLLEWLHGVDEFLRRADASGLSQRLEEAHRKPRMGMVGEEELPRLLQKLGEGFRRLSWALHLARPIDIMEEAQNLLPLLDRASKEVRRWAKPFATVLDRVREEVSQLAYEEPEVLSKESLKKQLDIIRYFLDKGLYAQAILLAREWMINWAVLQGGEGDWLERDVRSEAEKALGMAHNRARGEKKVELPDWLERLPWEGIGKLWSWVSVNLRNDLAHCGMRKGAASAKNIMGRAKKIPERLEKLLDGAPDRLLVSGRVTVDLCALYDEVAKLEELPSYIEKAVEMAGEGNEVVLTGQAPIWLYLAVAHALHGKARRLVYNSPVTGEVVIFDHTPGQNERE